MSIALDASATASNVDAATERLMLSVSQPPGRDNHKAGWIGFRSSDPGQLHIATGDGGAGNDPDNVAQNLTNNLGKILRVTPSAGGGTRFLPTTPPYPPLRPSQQHGPCCWQACCWLAAPAPAAHARQCGQP